MYPDFGIDPTPRRAYEHLEYSPLINQRIHRLGADNRILNAAERGQYQAFAGWQGIIPVKPVSGDDAFGADAVKFCKGRERIAGAHRIYKAAVVFEIRDTGPCKESADRTTGQRTGKNAMQHPTAESRLLCILLIDVQRMAVADQARG